jgi:hypothetical protein
MAEKVSTQAREAVDKMSAATSEAAGAVQNSYSVALEGVQDYPKSGLNSLKSTHKPPWTFTRSCLG